MRLYCVECEKPISTFDTPVVIEWGENYHDERNRTFLGATIAKAVHQGLCDSLYLEKHPIAPKKRAKRGVMLDKSVKNGPKANILAAPVVNDAEKLPKRSKLRQKAAKRKKRV